MHVHYCEYYRIHRGLIAAFWLYIAIIGAVRPSTQMSLATAIANIEHLKVFDEVAAARMADIDIGALSIYLIDQVGVPALVYLGEQFDVMGYKGWFLAPTPTDQRALIKKAVELHRRKGTPWSIREAIKALGFNDVEIIENVNYGCNYDGLVVYSGVHNYSGGLGLTFCFDVTINLNNYQYPLVAAQYPAIIALINEYKNVRSWLIRLSFEYTDTENVSVTESTVNLLNSELYDDELEVNNYYNGNQSYGGSIQYDSDQTTFTVIP